MAVSSGMAKSMGLFVVNTFGVTEFWMPALIGGLAFPLLILMGWSLNKLPQTTDADRALRSARDTLSGEQRRHLCTRCVLADHAVLRQSVYHYFT